MTFMLGYAWKRQNRAGKASNGRLSPAPLTEQASGDSSIPDQDENRTPTPPTPEGLRPRKPLDTIREELELPAYVLKQQKYVPNFLPHLPPTPILPFTSLSPQVTNSSFYSRDSSSVMIAESPDLAQARTAVGALVALSQGVVCNKPIRTDTTDSRLGVLPPRTWEQGRDDEEDIARLGVLPPRTWGQLEVDDDVEVVSYQRLDDSMDDWSPGRMRNVPASPDSTWDSSIHPSPSGSSYRRWQEEKRNVSFSSSRERLVSQQVGRPLAYNFGLITQEERQDAHDGPHFVVASDENMTNVSILSQSSAPLNDSIRSAEVNDSIHSLDSVQYSYGSRSQYRYEQRQESVMEDALLQRKAKNQRRAKEQLLMGIVQRLQHSLDLVADVDALHEAEDHWFVKTPMDKEGLLTGFSNAIRSNVLNYVGSVLSEMFIAQPEEFFLSPSQMESIPETHDDLHDALIFLQGMLQISIPLKEQNPGQRWTCASEIRSAMGITSIPESPESVHGGDTSVFSLPTESTTPHTSNVSLATTITSKPSPYRGTRSSPTHVAGQIRRTIEIITTLLQKMSLACIKLASKTSSQDVIGATEEIKRNYLQLLALSSQDVKSVVDAFVVVDTMEDLQLARQVSDDEDHVQEQQNGNSVLPSEPTTDNYKVMGNKVFCPCSVDMQSPRIESDDDERYEADDLRREMVQSPRIESDDDERYEADDLRREMGSNDYDDNMEERDAPEEDIARNETPVRLEDVPYYQWGASELSTTPLQK